MCIKINMTYIHTNIHTHTYSYIHNTYIQTYIHNTYIHMVSELGECIPCFSDNRWRNGATGSDLGNGMKKFVKAKKDFNIP